MTNPNDDPAKLDIEGMQKEHRRIMEDKTIRGMLKGLELLVWQKRFAKEIEYVCSKDARS